MRAVIKAFPNRVAVCSLKGRRLVHRLSGKIVYTVSITIFTRFSTNINVAVSVCVFFLSFSFYLFSTYPVSKAW